MKNILSHLPDASRVWIYTSNLEFTPDQIIEIKCAGDAFVAQWQTHGKPLDAGFALVHNRFVLLAVNEKIGKASGCSIDTYIALVKDIELRLGLSLLDKLNLAYREANQNIAVLPLNAFKNEISIGNLNAQTLVFNNMIETLGEMRNIWEVPLVNSWHKQLL